MIPALAAAAVAAALALIAPAGAHAAPRVPDAEIFATSNTAVISDPDDPRLDDRLGRFARTVNRLVREGGAAPRGSELLDGVFFSSDFVTTTFERSRRFDEDWWLAMASGAVDALRAQAGVPGDPCAERARRAPVLTQVPMTLDEHQGELPALVRRYRVPPPLSAGPPAGWWKDSAAPLVPVSFGTVLPTDGHFPGLYREVIDALAGVPARVLVTVGRHADPAELGAPPPNVHVERWVAQASVMPHAAAMVAHGGAGTTLAALAAGVPLVLLPLSADQPINARRVAELGAGLSLDGGTAGVPRLAAAVARVLEEPGYREAARRVAADVATLPPVAEAAADLSAIAQLQRAA